MNATMEHHLHINRNSCIRCVLPFPIIRYILCELIFSDDLPAAKCKASITDVQSAVREVVSQIHGDYGSGAVAQGFTGLLIEEKKILAFVPSLSNTLSALLCLFYNHFS